MYAPETSEQQADQQHRTSVLNREMVRMRGEGWSVQMADGYLVASRRESGRSQLERVLICVAGMLAIAYLATIAVPDIMDSLGVSKPIYYVGAVAIGALAALVSGGQSAKTRTVQVSIDGQGRPFTTDA